MIEQNSYICSEDSDISSITEGYITVDSIYSFCSEEANYMEKRTLSHLRGEKHPLFGRCRPEETKKKISDAQKGEKNHRFGKHNSEEHKQKISIGNRGKHGYWKGKHKPRELVLRVAEKLKGRPNPRKGSKISEEHKKNISFGQMGRYVPKGEDSPLYQKPRPAETRKKISEALKGKYVGSKHPQYGQHLGEETRRKISEAHRGFHHTEESKRKMSERSWLKNAPPERTPGWKGGISYLPYCIKFNKTLKNAVRERDNHTCQLCGIKENCRKLDVHHVHHDKENCYPDLISLCHACHAKASVNRNLYERVLMNILNHRGLLLWTANKRK